jgi:glycogen debranching enzyme
VNVARENTAPKRDSDVADPRERVRWSSRAAGLDWRGMVANDAVGDIDVAKDPEAGYFIADTRLLSSFRLLLNGAPLEFFSSESVDSFSTRYRLQPQGREDERLPLVIYRHEVIDVELVQHLVVVNDGDDPIECELSYALDADFADIFELRENLRERDVSCSARDAAVRFDYERDGFSRSVTVRAVADGAHADGRMLRLPATIPGRGAWCATVTAAPGDRVEDPYDGTGARKLVAARRQHHDDWANHLPRLHAEWRQLEAIYRQSIRDLEMLTAHRRDGRGFTFGAGAPLLMALFGRDPIWISTFLLGFDDRAAEATLLSLAALQGRASLDRYDEDPGRIHHELRSGELAFDGTRPDSPYYGTVDATPLFLVLLDEHRRHTGDDGLARDLEPAARAALEWITAYGDLDGDGYVEYERRNTENGLENQCWKDSDDSIRFRDGRFGQTPLAVCEVQGYVYDAKRRCAGIARDVWGDAALAERLEREAAELRERFNRDFWMEDRGSFALALDAQKRQVDSLTSNAGHLLFSGIADDDKAARVADVILSDAMFSGYGVRTMARGDAAYDPVSYHNGSVWPHDNAIVAAGLLRYGMGEQADAVAAALFDASCCYGYRMPEVFAGFDRSETGFAVEYPDAQVPLAMASAAVMLLLRTILRLEPGWTHARRESDRWGAVELRR